MPAKHALIIGVNKYPKLVDKYQLRGCVNDAKLVKDILVEQFKFDESDISELHDEAASAKAILAGMEDLIDRVDKDDVVVFHFSGHGRPRRSKTLEEGMGKENGIMPSDSGVKEENVDIRDDTINEWLGRLSEKTRFITLIFDCCFSGTITREAFGATARAIEEDVNDADAEAAPAAPVKKGPSGFLALSDRYVVLSGCRDNEKAKEFSLEEGSRYSRNGALTYYLTRALLAAKPGTTYRDVFELAHLGVNARFPTQHPQIEGMQDREIFGVRDIEPMRYIPIAAVDGNFVTLNGGAAHGLHSDTRWVVYPHGTKQAQASESLGLIEVRDVGPLTSDAVIIESTGEITAGARCVEKIPFAGQFPLQIDLDELPAEFRAVLEPRIQQSGLLAVAPNTDAADARAYVLEPRESASAEDPMPDIDTVETPSWALVNLESELSLPLLPVSQEDAVSVLIHNLETGARYRNALKLDNPNSELDVQFNIFRVSRSGDLEPANNGDFEFEDGDRLAFEISNNESVPVYLSLLNFGLNGQIKLLYPRKRASELIAAGVTIRKAAGRKKLRVNLKGFDGERGTQYYKAFVATEPVDLTWLRQRATKLTAATPSGLARQFTQSYNGDGTRGDWDDDDSDDDDRPDWIAITRSVVVRRKQD